MKSIHIVRGKKRTQIDLAKDAPDGAALAAVLLGPTGNLRAPTLKQGTTMLVGFSPELYAEVLG